MNGGRDAGTAAKDHDERWEDAADEIPAVKLAGPLGKTYYRIGDIEALVGAGSEPDDPEDRRGLLV